MTLIFSPFLAIVADRLEESLMADDVTNTPRSTGFSEQEIAARRAASQAGAHQGRMEGLPPIAEDEDLHEAFVRGEITEDELIATVAARAKIRRAKVKGSS